MVAWGYTEKSIKGPLTALHQVFLKDGSVRLEDVKYETIHRVYEVATSPSGSAAPLSFHAF